MAHTFFSCIPTERCKPLPEDVWMDILSRLSAKDLLRCQVCLQALELFNLNSTFQQLVYEPWGCSGYYGSPTIIRKS